MNKNIAIKIGRRLPFGAQDLHELKLLAFALERALQQPCRNRHIDLQREGSTVTPVMLLFEENGIASRNKVYYTTYTYFCQRNHGIFLG